MIELSAEQAAVQALTKFSRMCERGLSEISLADFRVLAAIGHGEERASRLAARLIVGKPTISASVESLIRRGLLVKTTHNDDLRAFMLTLTSEGEKARADAERHLIAVLREVLGEVADPQKSLTVLAELWEALERVHLARSDRRSVDEQHTEAGIAR